MDTVALGSSIVGSSGVALASSSVAALSARSLPQPAADSNHNLRRMQRRSLDWQIRDELAMWRGVLAAETNRLRLTLPEANCIADVLMGHAKVTTTLGVYTHLFNTDDHADAMAALGAMGTGMTPSYGDNVIQLHG